MEERCQNVKKKVQNGEYTLSKPQKPKSSPVYNIFSRVVENGHLVKFDAASYYFCDLCEIVYEICQKSEGNWKMDRHDCYRTYLQSVKTSAPALLQQASTSQEPDTMKSYRLSTIVSELIVAFAQFSEICSEHGRIDVDQIQSIIPTGPVINKKDWTLFIENCNKLKSKPEQESGPEPVPEEESEPGKYVRAPQYEAMDGEMQNKKHSVKRSAADDESLVDKKRKKSNQENVNVFAGIKSSVASPALRFSKIEERRKQLKKSVKPIGSKFSFDVPKMLTGSMNAEADKAMVVSIDRNVSGQIGETSSSAWNFAHAEQSVKKPKSLVKKNAEKFSFMASDFSYGKDAETSQMNAEDEPMDLSMDRNVSDQIQDTLMDVSMDRNLSGGTSSSVWNFVNTGQLMPMMPMMHTKSYADQFPLIMASIHENAKKLTSQVNAEDEPMDLSVNRNVPGQLVDKAFPMVSIPKTVCVNTLKKRPRDDDDDTTGAGNTEGSRKKMKFASPKIELERVKVPESSKANAPKTSIGSNSEIKKNDIHSAEEDAKENSDVCSSETDSIPESNTTVSNEASTDSDLDDVEMIETESEVSSLPKKSKSIGAVKVQKPFLRNTRSRTKAMKGLKEN